MNQELVLSPKELFSTGQIRLAELSVFNWGSFHGLHTARIDPDGTLITGDNGAGKSTLVDGLMALLLPSNKTSFNTAAAQGDRTDRTLMTYIRGNFGKAHDGNETSTLLKRSGATATALRAMYRADDSSRITLISLYWITQASNSLADLKRLFVIARRDMALEEILSTFGQGNARALKQHIRELPDVDYFENFSEYQETYARLLRMENRNAPALLARALGLKRIDDLTGLIRELVLEPSEVKQLAREAVVEFDDLVSIHQELVDARSQRDLLAELPEFNTQAIQASAELDALISEIVGLPIYFGEQGARLWGLASEQINKKLQRLHEERQALDEQERNANERTQRLYYLYQSQGGARLDGLRQEVEGAQAAHAQCIVTASRYQRDVRSRGLNEVLTLDAFLENQAKAKSALSGMPAERKAVQDAFADAAAILSTEQQRLGQLDGEVKQIQSRPESNIEPSFQLLRDQLAKSLSLDSAQLVFIGELIDVQEEHRSWQGAIERAFGGLRTTLLVPHDQYRLVTRWLNGQHTGLHVRVQVVKPGQPKNAEFMGDGFLRKLQWKPHPFRDWLKKHLERFDLHCVDSTETLNVTEFSMTIQGLIHYSDGRFEKKDRQDIADRRYWYLGFSNTTRLAALQNEYQKLNGQLEGRRQEVEHARQAMNDFENAGRAWNSILQTAWKDIDVVSAEQHWRALRTDLDALEHPDSELGIAKARWDEANTELSNLKKKITQLDLETGQQRGEFETAQSKLAQAQEAARPGVTDDVRERLTHRVGQLQELPSIDKVFRRHRDDAEEARDQAKDRKSEAEHNLSVIMHRFKDLWPLQSLEWLATLADVEQYLEYLSHLESEGLPDLVERFRERLNRNATHTLAHLSQVILSEREEIQDRIQTINEVLARTEFKSGTYLRLNSRSEEYLHVKDFNLRLRRILAYAGSDDHEARYDELKSLIAVLEKATNPATANNLESLRLLDSRHQMSFFAEEVDKETLKVLDVLESSGGKSGGEKESFAGTIVAASLAYVLTPDGYDRPLYCTVFLDEAFSNTAEAVSRRVLKVFRELKIHINLITPYKNLNLARESARSLLIAERDQKAHESRLCEVTWEEIDRQMAQARDDLETQAHSLGIETEMQE